MPSAEVFHKVPNDDEKYTMHFAGSTVLSERSDYLDSGETISSHTVTHPAGVTAPFGSTATDGATSITFWVGGGTVGEEYDVTVQVTTSNSRVIERVMTFVVVATL